VLGADLCGELTLRQAGLLTQFFQPTPAFAAEILNIGGAAPLRISVHLIQSLNTTTLRPSFYISAHTLRMNQDAG